jgi:hypothetical protein
MLLNINMTSFHKLASNLNIGISECLDDILHNIPDELSNEKNSPDVFVWNVPKNKAYWQYYPYTRTRFTRNFGRRFPDISKHIAEQLNALRSSIKIEAFNDQKMYQAFINHKFDYQRVQLSKIISGIDVLPHIDNGREYVINIGVRNSNTCKVFISDSQNTKDFWQGNLQSFVMEDNEAYILNVDNAHAVKPLVKANDNLDRYLITYMLTEC